MTESHSIPTDVDWMTQALELASLGLNSTSPNPRVGCLLVKDNLIVGSGWHQWAGQDHAEVMALKEAQGLAVGATAYVTLEPCNHHGRTPPCTEALIKAGVVRVVVAVEDCDPRTAGGGIERLRQAGIQVDVGVCEAEGRELNLGFLHRHQLGRPWIRMKLACSLDGRVTGPDGQSKWITSKPARADGHRWRARACAVLTGIETLLADDPSLNARPEGLDQPLLQPIRIVIDSHARTPEHAKIWGCDGPVWILSTQPAPAWFASGLAGRADQADEWHVLPQDRQGRVDLQAILALPGTRQINELHIEAGPTLSGAFFEQGWVDELLVYQAPVLLGQGRPMLDLPALQRFDQRWALTLFDSRMVGVDQRLIYRHPVPSGQQLNEQS